jgi:hypothetical protein
VFWPGFTYLLVFFFLFFYPLKLVTSFANVTSFKLKIMTLFSTSTISLNLFMEIILSLTWHIYCHPYYLFISFIPNIHYSSKCHYFDPMCCFLLLLLLFIFIYGGLQKITQNINFFAENRSNTQIVKNTKSIHQQTNKHKSQSSQVFMQSRASF